MPRMKNTRKTSVLEQSGAVTCRCPGSPAAFLWRPGSTLGDSAVQARELGRWGGRGRAPGAWRTAPAEGLELVLSVARSQCFGQSLSEGPSLSFSPGKPVFSVPEGRGPQGPPRFPKPQPRFLLKLPGLCLEGLGTVRGAVLAARPPARAPWSPHRWPLPPPFARMPVFFKLPARPPLRLAGLRSEDAAPSPTHRWHRRSVRGSPSARGSARVRSRPRASRTAACAVCLRPAVCRPPVTRLRGLGAHGALVPACRGRAEAAAPGAPEP